MMKLWLLKRDKRKVGWDQIGKAVVRAETKESARNLLYKADNRLGEVPEWLDPEKSECSELIESGKGEVVVAHVFYG